jgi:hypothetical protein
MNDNIIFSQIHLAEFRKEAKKLNIKVPKGLTATKQSTGDWWYVSDKSGSFREEVTAHNAYDAKAKVIEKLIDAAKPLKFSIAENEEEGIHILLEPSGDIVCEHIDKRFHQRIFDFLSTLTELE